MKRTVSWKNLRNKNNNNNNNTNNDDSVRATHYSLAKPIFFPAAVAAPKSVLTKNASSVAPTFTKATPGLSMPSVKTAPLWYEDLPERKSLKKSPAEIARAKALERVYGLAGSGPEVTEAERREQAARTEIDAAQEAVVLSVASVLGGDAQTMTLDDIVEIIPKGSQYYIRNDAKWSERMWKQYKRTDKKGEYTPEELRFSKAVEAHANALQQLEKEKTLAAMGYRKPTSVKKSTMTRKNKNNNNNNNAARKNMNALSHYMNSTLRVYK